ncbi:GNAT family N-acetyltransferase [Streptomyces sp. NBC_00582]|uniref:GNAT family N-acetyltransferase n=1 Tax=Streptomyces sp. NBC_00582 TaxID=2975783 RepID=UPI001064561F|nr:GNAT family protein [Streptomyces sp. NBC_00582]WUB66640.1 GNAT family N-acetyltransferase [Streptomyces sp. NBC_00582]
MIWSRLRGARRAPRLPLPGVCGHGRHTVRTERLLLYTPRTQLDLAVCLAAGADPEAQRWLGWDTVGVMADAGVRRSLVQLRPADAGVRPPLPGVPVLLAQPYEPRPEHGEVLMAVRLDDGRYAGYTELHPGTGEIGGWLAPHARGLGLGTELFRAAALLGHDHLGLAAVRAGYEPANTASARALTAAGFVPADGPPRHRLRNGRVIDARWVRHPSQTPPQHCPGARAVPPDADRTD